LGRRQEDMDLGGELEEAFDPVLPSEDTQARVYIC